MTAARFRDIGFIVRGGGPAVKRMSRGGFGHDRAAVCELTSAQVGHRLCILRPKPNLDRTSPRAQTARKRRGRRNIGMSDTSIAIKIAGEDTQAQRSHPVFRR